MANKKPPASRWDARPGSWTRGSVVLFLFLFLFLVAVAFVCGAAAYLYGLH